MSLALQALDLPGIETDATVVAALVEEFFINGFQNPEPMIEVAYRLGFDAARSKCPAQP